MTTATVSGLRYHGLKTQEKADALLQLTCAALTGIVAAGRILNQDYQALNAVQTAILTLNRMEKAMLGEPVTDNDLDEPEEPATGRLTDAQVAEYWRLMAAEESSRSCEAPRRELKTGPEYSIDDESEREHLERVGQEEEEEYFRRARRWDDKSEGPSPKQFEAEHFTRAVPPPVPPLPSQPGETYDDYITRAIGNNRP